jgi:ribosomal protein L31
LIYLINAKFIVTAVSKPLQRFSNRYSGFQTVTAVSKPLQRFPNRYSGFQTVTAVSKPLQRFPNRYNGFQTVTAVSKPLQRFPNRYSDFQTVTAVFKPLQRLNQLSSHGKCNLQLSICIHVSPSVAQQPAKTLYVPLTLGVNLTTIRLY